MMTRLAAMLPPRWFALGMMLLAVAMTASMCNPGRHAKW